MMTVCPVVSVLARLRAVFHLFVARELLVGWTVAVRCLLVRSVVAVCLLRSSFLWVLVSDSFFSFSCSCQIGSGFPVQLGRWMSGRSLRFRSLPRSLA